MKTKLFINLLIWVASCAVNTKLIAQQKTSPAKHVTSEDSAAMNALVLYPVNIRTDIFEASEYPASIINIASLQKKINADFIGLIHGYGKETQEDFWNLSRYPDLITELVRGGAKSKNEIESIVSHYPADIHEAAVKEGRREYDVLKRMDELHDQTNVQFGQVIADYPPVTQAALKELIQYPEIISLLNEHLAMTVRIGDQYRRDSQEVIRKSNEQNLEEVRKNAEDAEAWKKSMEQDPQAANDLKSAANDYANQNGYSSEDINAQPDPDYVNNYTCAPYSYWFGYPTWYPYSYWYPYPFWFDCGFYFGLGGSMIFIGHPSYYFTHWYFYSPDHIRRYPYLGNSYIDHYYGSYTHIGGNDVIVRNWVNENRAYLPRDFTSNRANRVDAIRQVGQLNVDAQKAMGRNNLSSAERAQYYQKNSAKYPLLNTSHEPIKGNDSKQTVAEPEKQPAVKIPQRSNAAMSPAKSPMQEHQPVTKPSETNFSNMQKAQEYHSNVWNNVHPVQRSFQPARAPSHMSSSRRR